MVSMANFVNEAFVKKALIFSITSMVLMTGLLTIFAPSYDHDLEQTMTDLTADYRKFTNAEPTNQEIWALSGIYTPYGVDAEGQQSTTWGETLDGWVYGQRVERYAPSQFSDLDKPSGASQGREAYAVTYDKDRGLYYYTSAGSNLDVTVAEADPQTGIVDPEKGTLYTSVAMDRDKKSDIFFTPGGKQSLENGTFFYSFSGYRYCFQPLRDYKAADDTTVTAATTSLSLIWYSYYGDDGISGQIILSGADGGIAYITAQQILQAFDSANFSATFKMVFNGIDMNVIIKLNPWAVQHKSVQDCYANGYWSVMITSPSVSQGETGFATTAFSPEKAFEVIVNLLTFHTEDYGLSGMAGTIASLFFSVSLYTSLIAIGLSVWPVLILAGILTVIQGIGILT